MPVLEFWMPRARQSDVDWGKFISALYGVGYDYVVSIEHEDRAFEKTEELVIRGFLISRDVLTPYIK